MDERPAPPDTEPLTPARRSRSTIVVFLALVAVLLAADLAIKTVAFARVGDRPVILMPDWGAFEDYLREPTAADPPPLVVVVNDLESDRELSGQRHRVAIPGLLHFKLTTNTGAVFGLGAGKRWVFIIVSVFATVVVGYLFLFSPAKARWQHLGLALILAGALGNLYDRVRFAAVRDMFHMLPGWELPFGLTWPGGVAEVWPWVFNLADVLLLAGVGLILALTWLNPEAKPQSSTKAN